MTSLPTTTTTHVPTTVRPDGGALRPAQLVQPPSGMSIGQITSILLRHIWLILAVFVGVVLITGGVFVLFRVFGKEYTVRGQMQLAEVKSIMQPGEPRPPDKFVIDTRQREQAMRITSQQNLRMLLALPDAPKWTWLQVHERKGEGSALERLRENISASPIRDTTLVEVRMRDENPGAAAEMVNKLMHFYEDRTGRDAVSRTYQDRRVLNTETDKVQFNLNRINASLNDLQESPDFEGIERARAEVIDRVAQLGSMETQATLYLEQARRALDAVTRQYEDPNARASIDIRSRVDSTPAVVQLVARRQGLTEERAQLEKRGLGPNHQSIREINVRIDEVDAAVRDKREELIAQEKERTVQGARANFTGAEAQVETIRANLKDAKEKKKQLENMWAQYRSLQQEKRQNELEMARLAGLIREIEVRINRGIPQVTVFAEAAVPQRHEVSFPRWEIFLAAGIFLGVTLAVGLAVLIELVDTSVRTPRDLSEQVRLPLLGFVPTADELALSREQLCRLVASEPMSLMAESFRRIRTNLLFAAPVDQLNSIAITSAARDEGKTTVATNLGITVALSGRRVLLVDANFRRPSLATIFGLPAEEGLSNVLTNQATFAEVVRTTEVPNLAVVPTGPAPPNPAELMGSATMRAFLDQANAEYDLIIFDAPPALLVSDALVLGTMVDGVVAVVRAGKTSRGMVGRLRDQLRKVNARIVGAVLNAARPTRGGYFRKSRQQYEEYHNLPV